MPTTPTQAAPAGNGAWTSAVDLTELEVLALLQRHDTDAAAGSLELLDNRTRLADAELQRVFGEHGIVSLLVRRLARDGEGGPQPAELPALVAEVFGTATRWARLLAEIDGAPSLSLVASGPAGVAVAEPRGLGVWSFSAGSPGTGLGETVVRYVIEMVFSGRSPSAVIDLYRDDHDRAARLAVAMDADHPGRYAVVLADADGQLDGPATEARPGLVDERAANLVQQFIDLDGQLPGD